MSFRSAPAILVAIALALATPAAAVQYVIATGSPSRVTFESKAPVETFTGQTDQVSGTIELDPAAIADVITVQIEVEMASLATGLSLRDKHMRENHLHTEQFPRAVFTGGKLTDLSSRVLTPEQAVNGTIEGELPSSRVLTPEQTITGTMEGDLTLHGVTKPVTARFEMAIENNLLRIVARFGVPLADFEIPRPKFLMMKLGETQSVTVDLVAKPQ